MRSAKRTSPDRIADQALSILCVDDDADILTIVRLSLGLDAGIDVELARTADQALRLLVSPAYRPDCILLDVGLPNFDGKLLLGETREIAHHRETPVIFLTAHVLPTDLRSHLELGALGTISKPFDPLTLTHRIRSLLAGRSG